MDGDNKAKAKFVTPSIEKQSEILTFRLTVTDEKGGSDSAVTAVKINRDDGRLPTSKLLDEPPSFPSASSDPTGSSIGFSTTRKLYQFDRKIGDIHFSIIVTSYW